MSYIRSLLEIQMKTMLIWLNKASEVSCIFWLTYVYVLVSLAV